MIWTLCSPLNILFPKIESQKGHRQSSSHYLPSCLSFKTFGYRAYLSVQGIVLVVQMQDLNLCKQFIQLLVSQYEPFSCEIIIFAALSILIPISSARYLFAFVLAAYSLTLNQWLHERLCVNGCGGLLWGAPGFPFAGRAWELLNVRIQIRSLMLWILEGFFVERFCDLQQIFIISLA